MELSKKTTVLLTPLLHERLTYLARQKGTSLGELVREACEKEYGTCDDSEQRKAIEALRDLSLPVGDCATMKRESVEQ